MTDDGRWTTEDGRWTTEDGRMVNIECRTRNVELKSGLRVEHGMMVRNIESFDYFDKLSMNPLIELPAPNKGYLGRGRQDRCARNDGKEYRTPNKE